VTRDLNSIVSGSSGKGVAMDLDEEAPGDGTSAVYPARRIKRGRATKIQIQDRRQALYEIVAEQKPMTVRQVFYQATVLGVVEKVETGYDKVQRDLVEMRRDGMLPYGWIVDNLRYQRKPKTYGGIEQALREAARVYRRDLWDSAGCHIETWLEKDALSGVIYPVTELFDVPLMVARGYSSLSFLHEAAEYIGNLEVPSFIYHLGDYDPSGVDAGKKIERDLREFAPNAEIHFKRLAVNLDQIRAWNLPTRPTKTTDSRSKNFGDISVELDAIAPDHLRRIVKEAIERHADPQHLAAIYAAEESEKRLINGLVGMVRGGRYHG
jgi:hypothetical protein